MAPLPFELRLKFVPVEAKKRGRPRQHPVDALRTRLWFHVVKLRSGLTSAYAIELALDGDLVRADGDRVLRPRKWDAYAAGKRAPSGVKGKRDAVATADAAYPGTAVWYRSPIWKALRMERFDENELLTALRSLEPDVVRLLFKVDPLSADGNLVPRQLVKEDVMSLVGTVSFDSLVAAVLLAIQAEHVNSPTLRDWALAAYTRMQPIYAGMPETKPFYTELFDQIDRAIPYWIYPAPNQRGITFFPWRASPWAQRQRELEKGMENSGEGQDNP